MESSEAQAAHHARPVAASRWKKGQGKVDEPCLYGVESGHPLPLELRGIAIITGLLNNPDYKIFCLVALPVGCR